MAGRWVMASIQTSFAIMPAAVYWFGGLALARGSDRDHDPDARRLHDAADAALLPGRLAARRRPRRADLARAFRPDLRVPRPAGRHRGEAGRARRRRRPATSSSTTSGSATTTTGRCRTSRSRCPHGTTTALVGETGSGKTTLGYLAARLYDVSRGRDHDRRRRRPRPELRTRCSDLVGVVSQETYLFHASVRENLRFAKPDATDEEIEAAAEAARIHHVIAALPEGYDTVVGERGYRFSGGEKQRIAIARTILRNPPILVLDEATSSLDTETERLVQEALDRLSEGRTTIAIAHRLSTVRDADQIVVLDHGRVVETGQARGPAALAGGRYTTLAARDAERPSASLACCARRRGPSSRAGEAPLEPPEVVEMLARPKQNESGRRPSRWSRPRGSLAARRRAAGSSPRRRGRVAPAPVARDDARRPARRTTNCSACELRARGSRRSARGVPSRRSCAVASER